MKIDEVIKRPIVAYHGSRNDGITSFKPFTHFGSLRAARDRLNHNYVDAPEYIYKVKLNIKNPMRVRDKNKNHDSFAVLKGQISDREEYMTTDEYYKINSPEDLLNHIKSKGYDGIVYFNQYEDVGSESYIILDPSQAQIISKNIINETIRKIGDNKWRLYSKDGSKNLGTFDSLEAAKKHEREVQYFKHKK